MITRDNFWFFFGGLWFAVGSLFASIGAFVLWQQRALDARLASEGETASGIVLAKSMRGGTNQEPTFEVEYRYTPAAGTPIERTAKVDGRTWDMLVEEHPVAVRYARSDPRVHRIDGEGARDFVLGALFSGIGSLFAISGALILWRAFARRRLVERLLRDGPRAVGEVVAVKPTNFRINHEPQWAIRYRYRDAFGTTHEAKTPPMPQEQARRWRPGDRGQVSYDGDRPHRSVWIGER